MKKFTLIDLLALMVIIGILAALILPTLSNTRKHPKIASCKGNLKQIGTAVVMYYSDIVINPPDVPQTFSNIKGSRADQTNFNDPTIFHDAILSCPATSVSSPPTDGYRWHRDSMGRAFGGYDDSKMIGDEAPTNHKSIPFQYHVYQDGHVIL